MPNFNGFKYHFKTLFPNKGHLQGMVDYGTREGNTQVKVEASGIARK